MSSNLRNENKYDHCNLASNKADYTLTSGGVFCALQKINIDFNLEDADCLIGICEHSNTSFHHPNVSYSDSVIELLGYRNLSSKTLSAIQNFITKECSITPDYNALILTCCMGQLSQINFSAMDLCGADLNQVDFRGTMLNNIDFNWANLSGSDLRGVNWQNICLTGANFTQAIFDHNTIITLDLPESPSQGWIHQNLNHLNNDDNSSILTAIDSIDSKYPIKITLIKQVIAWLEVDVNLSQIKESIRKILQGDPVYQREIKVYTFIIYNLL